MSCIFNNNFLWSFDISLISGFQNPFHPWEGTKAKQGLMCHKCNCVFPADQAQDHLLLLKHAQTQSKPLFICFILIFLLYIFFYLNSANSVSIHKCCYLKGEGLERREQLDILDWNPFHTQTLCELWMRIHKPAIPPRLSSVLEITASICSQMTFGYVKATCKAVV